MTDSSILDRRQLRRKVSFWRVVSILLAGLAIVMVWVASGGNSDVPTRQRHIAVVSISGMILDDDELVGRLDKIAKDDEAKALVVDISSPGGSTYGGEILYKALRRVSAEKPVVINIRTLAASAGYMIALGGDHIIAGENSITGSIGVIFQFPQIKGLMDKLGVSLEEVKSAPLKAEPSPFHNATEDARAMIGKVVSDSYDWFVDLVAERRALPRETALKLADGSIFTGRQALANKLIDEVGGEKEIRAWLKGRKVDGELPFVRWEAPRTSSPFFLSGLADIVLQSLGLDRLMGAKSLKNMADDKLFLDGLVSTWQIGPGK